jgi:hypothetical protein
MPYRPLLTGAIVLRTALQWATWATGRIRRLDSENPIRMVKVIALDVATLGEC